MRGLRLLTGIAAGALLVSCGGGTTTPPDVPTPGNLSVALTGTVPAGAGAIELTVTGATKVIDTLSAGAGYTGYSRRLNTRSIRAVLIGSVTAGSLATIHVPDTRKVSDYSVTVTAAANGTTYALMNSTAFSVDVAAP